MSAPVSVPNSIGSAPISSLALKKPVFLPETSTLTECSETMRSGKETFLLINNDRESTIGIFTERDMVLCYWSPEIDESTPVMAVMNRKFVTIDESSSTRDAVDLMGANEISQLPVLDKAGSVKGVLTVEQLLENLSDAFPKELLNLSSSNQIPAKRVGG
jgi:signal-transduction protein with cAMP-binding, CBS, and nucleotidyltransferase domain